MHRTYAGVGWGMIALGLVHIAAATRYYDQLTQAALWFVSGGLAIILTGVLNLLNRTYGHAAPGLRRACATANVFMALFALLIGLVGHASAAELVIIVGLFGVAAVLALMPRALAGRGSA